MEVDDVQQRNYEILLEHGPGLRYDYGHYIVARCPGTSEVCLGGLGGMGVGRMWFTEEPSHANLPGYANAVIVSKDNRGRHGLGVR